MRDLFVTAAVFSSLPFILWRPWLGIVVFTWLGFMNPHRLTWGFAYEMPFAMIVALATMVGTLVSREEKRIPWTRETVLLLVFVAWMALTTLFAVYPELAANQWNKVWKIQLMIFILLILMQRPERIQVLVWTIVLSLGFYGVKGGIFTVMTGGAYHVRGPVGTFIGGDNEIGLALIMTIPLMRYLQLTAGRAVVRYGLLVAMPITALAVVGSQSRGALLGLVAMGVFLWLKSRKKLVTAVLVGLAIVPILLVMPEQWYARMSTIQDYQQDGSALGRINAWWMAFNLARDRVFGGGFETFRREMFAIYAPEPGRVHDAHSIYFEVLGEHGFVGFALFLALGVMTWLSASWVARHARGTDGMRWMSDLARMIQVSLVGYGTAGAFLGLAYFDYYYTLVAIVVLCRTLLEKRLAERVGEASAADAGRSPALAPVLPGAKRWGAPEQADSGG
jgi:probable O-glycosylation ligase (exosortase A-associated)